MLLNSMLDVGGGFYLGVEGRKGMNLLGCRI